MNNTARQMSQPVETGTALPLVPGEHIYIYYLKGRADTCQANLGPDFIGNWEEADCSFLFFTAPAEEAVRKFLNERPMLTLADIFDMPYREWQPMDGLPLTAGGFNIYPPWDPPIESSEGTHLLLDPGLVFGSGFHATTHDCLEALSLMCYNSKNVKTALDIGTGTGMLSIAAALRGVERIVGVDNNLLAAQTARHNVMINNVNDRVLIIKGSAMEPAYKRVDLLMANIHYEIMDTLIDSPLFLNSRWFILSGLLRTPVKKILKRLNNLSVDILNIWNSNQIWYTILGKQGVELPDQGHNQLR